jgi:hypothetical protein
MYFPEWDLQPDGSGLIVRIAQLSPAPGRRRRDVAVDAVQATLGEVLLLLGSLAALLFAVILLLLEAKVILHLGGQLDRELRFVVPPAADGPPATQERRAFEPAPGEERRNDAAG